MNWKELKDFCNALPEQELPKKVIMWREDECVNDIEAEVLDQDHYIDPEGQSPENCFPETHAREIIEDKDAYPNGMSDLKKVYDKGRPILWENF